MCCFGHRMRRPWIEKDPRVLCDVWLLRWRHRAKVDPPQWPGDEVYFFEETPVLAQHRIHRRPVVLVRLEFLERAMVSARSRLFAVVAVGFKADLVLARPDIPSAQGDSPNEIGFSFKAQIEQESSQICRPWGNVPVR